MANLCTHELINLTPRHSVAAVACRQQILLPDLPGTRNSPPADGQAAGGNERFRHFLVPEGVQLSYLIGKDG
jgi:hypothetical protein